MKKRILALAVSLLLLLGSVPAAAFAQGSTDSADYGTPGVDYVDGEVVACVKGGAAALKSGNSGLSAQSAVDAEDIMDVSAATDALTTAGADTPAQQSLVVVRGSDTLSLIDELSDNPAVEYVEPNYILKPAKYSEPETMYNPGYVYQWGLKNQENSSKAAEDADMNVKGAWDQTEGATPVVAVLDSGVDYNNPDLSGVMWSDGLNHKELTALGGGKYGYNPANADTTDPMDTESGHGTHCAGVIAAQWDNLSGGVGVSPNAKIMALKMFADGGGGNTVMALKAYNYMVTAKRCGVNVVAVNNSWGSTYNGTVIHSISKATEIAGEAGIVSCFAAGNDGTNNDENVGINVMSPYVVMVGAMDSQGYPTAFSEYGQRSVDVFAPGSQILSTTTTHSSAERPNSGNEMPMRYLPQLGEDNTEASSKIGCTNESYFYEDFEKTTKVDLKVYDKDGNLVSGADQSTTAGCASSKGTQIPLSGITDGEAFSIELSFPKSEITDYGYDGKNAAYLALQAQGGDAASMETYRIQVKGSDGTWTNLLTNEVRTAATASSPAVYYPAGLRITDRGWNSSSQQLLTPGDLLNSTDGNNIFIRLSGTKSANESTFRLDDFGIGKTPSAYYYADGTSMATPMTTGTVALMSTKYTDTSGTTAANAAEIIARIKGSVNTTKSGATGMDKKCVTGGYVDAAAAMNDATVMNPVLNSLTVDGTTATIKGYFFGDTQGSVTIGNYTAAVTSWTARAITVSLAGIPTGTPEVQVTRSDVKSGHNYFDIEPTYKGYTDLTAPALAQGSTETGIALSSIDGMPMAAAAAGHTFCYLGYMLETRALYMEAYDTQTQQWRSISLPSESIVSSGLSYLTPMAGGKSKIYLLYTAAATADKEAGVYIATLDPDTDTWTTVRTTSLTGVETLAVYKDQLLAIGGLNIPSYTPSTAVKVVDPVTGDVIPSAIPDLPAGRCCLTACTSGDTLVVAGGYDGITAAKTAFYNSMVYDGTKWTDNQDTFFDKAATNPYFDAKQTLNFAVGATDGGLIVAGPVKNLTSGELTTAAAGSDQMVDTWRLNGSTWSADESLLFNSRKTIKNVGASLDGQFYALGYQDGLKDNLVFRSTAVDYTAPTADPSAFTSYKVTRGANQTVNVNTGSDASFTTTISKNSFIGRVQVDGADVDAANYTVTYTATGKVMITLKAAYLATLSAGDHTLVVVARDGYASTTFTVSNAASDSGTTVTTETSASGGPNTGIAEMNTDGLIAAAALIAAACALGVALIRRRRG